MKRLRRKLNSQSGASILMALLLLLVCIMVAASILAAAVSNAGKARSNRVEQQKYLTLSSAIRLIADEIQQAEYTGKYNVYEWEVTTPAAIVDGVTVPARTDYYFYVEQAEGDFTCGGLANTTALVPWEVLPLRDGLDKIFSKQFTGDGCQPLYNAAEAAGTTKCTLTVTLPLKADGTVDLEGYPDSGPEAYRAEKEVTVQVVLDHATRHITLTAWMKNPDSPDPENGVDTMVAELVAKVTETVPAVPPAVVGTTRLVSGTLTADYNPGARLPGNRASADAAGASSSPRSAAGVPMKWELNWIKKGAAG